ncbi:LOG family protein yvdD [Listeria fleischmannii subsp. coloradonensis]|nr:LOG family protein yvdD [Listeria fleischmannii subsp. coloradonensis]
MLNIAVYCGASVGEKDEYAKSAQKLGQWIVDSGHNLVYGGGKVGLMGIVSDTVLDARGEVYGVMPQFLVDREIAHDKLTDLIITQDMHERKKKMMQLANVYIALPGGPGTLEEISEVISWGRVGEHQNPCIFFNAGGYYHLVQLFYDKMVEDGFLSLEDRANILFSDNFAEIETFISNYKAASIRQY